jgi:hypothetical protein
LGILDRAIARGSGCERLINAFGGPQGVRAACARHGITFPAQSAENKPQDWARIPTLRAQWLIALESGQRLERVACNLVRTVWEPLVRPLVNLGYFKRPAPDVIVRTDKPGPIPTEAGEIMSMIHRARHSGMSRMTPQSIRESFLREIRPGQTVSRPEHVTPNEWASAMSPLVRLGYREAVGHTDPLSAVRRTDKPDMPTNTNTLRAASDKATKRTRNCHGRATR